MIYAVGDIHGRYRALKSVVRQIQEHAAEHGIARPKVVFLGDYGDRGPNSREVFDLLISDELKAGIDATFIRGNHEDALLQALDPRTDCSDWLIHWGGAETVESYGVWTGPRTPEQFMVDFRKNFPQTHRAFLKCLPLWHQEEGLLFVHAGVNPDRPLDKQTRQDLLHIRDPFLNSTSDFGVRVIHGHSPSSHVVIRDNRIGADTGSGYEGGRLSAVAIDGDEIIIFEEMDF